LSLDIPLPTSAGTAPPRPTWLVRDLRSDHAGETGAVWIYKAILAISRDSDVRAFATRHLETEQRHLAQMEVWVPSHQRSRLLPVWRVAGFMTGAIPALLGREWVFHTIEAVETFVDRHYAEQVERLAGMPAFADLRDLMETCRLDECEHRDEAAESATSPGGPLLRAWAAIVGTGSAMAVEIVRRV
jgi:3-demethoxyubiquinol 3-hydroxylase